MLKNKPIIGSIILSLLILAAGEYVLAIVTIATEENLLTITKHLFGSRRYCFVFLRFSLAYSSFLNEKILLSL